MARKTFFSFHYERDAWRAAIVRNCNEIADEDEYGVIDAAEWEQIKAKGDGAIKAWIQEQLQSTSVTAVLIGAETASRPWVKYEIAESWKRGNGIVGIRIHDIKNQDQQSDTQGVSPFSSIFLEDGTSLDQFVKTYDWTLDDGRTNMSAWVEEAARLRGKAPNSAVKGIAVGVTQTAISNPPAQWNEQE
jgi:hypothetical protein